MYDALGLTIAISMALLAAWALIPAALDHTLPPVLAGAFVVAELVLVAQALLGVLDLVDGHELSDPVVTGAYLLVTVGAIPLGNSTFQGEETRWRSAALAVCAIVVLVVNWRLHATW